LNEKNLVFPKNTAPQDLMAESPSEVGNDELDKVAVAINRPKAAGEAV
jgi:aspartyl-tRNA synthetase